MSDREKVERAFAPIGEAVESFAAERSLRLETCARGNTGWELTGPHPRGGDIFLLLLWEDRLGLGVGSVWQLPCPEMSSLYSHFRPVQPCAMAADIVITALESELQSLSQVAFGYWTHMKPLQPPS